MAKVKEGALVVAGEEGRFQIATVEDLSAFMFMDSNALDIVKENLGGQEMSAGDFERMKFPSGGAQNWEIIGLNGEAEAVKEIPGIILMYRTSRVYWEKEFTGEGAPPDCQSNDLMAGNGNPGGSCATCPYAQWDSGKNGGQACKTIGTLFMLKPGESVPVVVPVPVASLKLFKKFMLGLSSHKIRYSNAIVGIGLSQDQNSTGIKYSKIKPRLISVLPDEAKEQIGKFIAAFKNSMDKATVSREQLDS